MVRDANSLLANAPTDKELSRARWCHLLALPGMLVLGGFSRRCVWQGRILITCTSEPSDSVRVLAAATEVAVCAESWQGSVELSVVVESSSVRNFVRAISTGGIRVVAYVISRCGWEAWLWSSLPRTMRRARETAGILLEYRYSDRWADE